MPWPELPVSPRHRFALCGGGYESWAGRAEQPGTRTTRETRGLQISGGGRRANASERAVLAPALHSGTSTAERKMPPTSVSAGQRPS